MFKFGSNSLGFLGSLLILLGIALGSLFLVRPQLVKRQDVVLIAVALICGGIFATGKRYLDGVIEFSLYLLTIPVVFYAIDTLRLRAKRIRRENL